MQIGDDFGSLALEVTHKRLVQTLQQPLVVDTASPLEKLPRVVDVLTGLLLQHRFALLLLFLRLLLLFEPALNGYGLLEPLVLDGGLFGLADLAVELDNAVDEVIKFGPLELFCACYALECLMDSVGVLLTPAP